MKYIIMAGGKYKHWETPKQMTVICGEPIIARTIRLLREAGITDIAISSNNPVFEQFGVPVLHHENNFEEIDRYNAVGWWSDCFYPTDDPVCYMYGDVVYSPEAIKRIVEYETDDIMLFGSKKPFAECYPKSWREPFAYKVVNQKHLREAIEETKTLHQIGAIRVHPISWQLWRVIATSSWKLNDYEVINDYTCDIDSPSDVPLMEKLISRV